MKRARLEYDTPHVPDAQALDLLRRIIAHPDTRQAGDIVALGLPVVFDGTSLSYDRSNPFPEVVILDHDHPKIALDNDIPRALMPDILRWFSFSEARGVAGCDACTRLAASLVEDVRIAEEIRAARMILWFAYDFLIMEVWSAGLGDRFGIARSRIDGNRTDFDELMFRSLATRERMRLGNTPHPARMAVLAD